MKEDFSRYLSVYPQTIKNENPELYQAILDYTKNFKGLVAFRDKLKIYINQIKPGRCKVCDAETGFSGTEPREFCSKKCSAKFNRNRDEVKEKTKNTCIKKYGVENPNQFILFRNKAKQTCIERYGHENPTCNSIIIEKVKETNRLKYGSDFFVSSDIGKTAIKNSMLEKYGVDNIGKVKEFRLKSRETFNLNFPEGSTEREELYKSIKNSTLRRSDVVNWRNNQDLILLEMFDGATPLELGKKYNVAFSTIYKFVNEHASYLITQNTEISLPHQKILDLLSQNSIDYKVNDRNAIEPKELDIYIPEHKLGIEINGLYWHTEQFKDKLYHLNKTKQCDKEGIQLLHFTDYEIINKFDIVSSIILNKLQKSDKIHARKCIIKEISNNDYMNFCEINHIQGYAISGVRLGLYHNDNLVSVMSFGKSRYDKNYEWELIRFCSLINTSVIGAASKLFKYFNQKYAPISIISYANRNRSNGNLYNLLEFELDHYSSPNYVYTDGKEILSRYQCQKHKLSELLKEKFDDNLSEYENMINAGWDKLYDCGNAVYLWKKAD